MRLVSHMAHLDRVFHSLSDGTRRAVIAQLANGPASIGDLAQRHRMALPSFMKHIRVLEASDIVTSRKIGRRALLKTPSQNSRLYSKCFLALLMRVNTFSLSGVSLTF